MALMWCAMSDRPSIARRSRRARLRFRAFPLEKRLDLFHERVCRDAVLLPKDRYRAVFDKLIGPANPHYRRVDHLAVEMLHDGATESVVKDVVFNRADDFDAARKEFEGAGVDRLDPARISSCFRLTSPLIDPRRPLSFR